MFNNVIYVIVVMLLYSISFPGSRPETSLPLSLALFFLCWLIFALYCKLSFQRLQAHSSREEEGKIGVAGRYQGLLLRLSALAILLFAVDVWLLHMKYWLHAIPIIGGVNTVEGVMALMVFMSYLMTVWFFAHPAYVRAFRTELTRRSFVFSNMKLNVSIVFPYVFLSLVLDLLALVRWPSLQQFLSEPAGEMVFFAVFLGILMIFLPSFIQYWWGCKPFPPSEKAEVLREFLREKGFKYREMLQWPIFEGRMLTAGIMGLVPRYRYILVTQSLMDILSEEELKAVLAHEMGHAKYRHLPLYLLFFLGFMALSYGLFNVSFYFLESHPLFSHLLQEGDARSASLFYLLLSLPILVTMFVYFRYVMGFFMRHFERQADLYSAQFMGSPKPIISSLEKIALLGGRIRDLPSWHHFSIRERVDCLWRIGERPDLVKRHNRFLALTFVIYLVLMVGLGYLFDFSPMKENLLYGWLEQTLRRQIEAQPHNPQLYQDLAMIYQKLGKDRGAIKTYEQLIQLDPDQSLALNNLAWLLATSEDKRLRDGHRALELAKRAVSLDRSPMYLDTLAEAYYVNGMIPEAVESIKEAIALAKENKDYYESQLRKFKGKVDSG